MKKPSQLIVAAILIFALAGMLGACGASSESSATSAVASSAETQTTATEKSPSEGNSKGEEITLKFSTHLPETAVDGKSLKYFLEEVSKATGGKVKFEYYFSQALVKTGDSLNAVKMGTTDIQFIPEGFFQSQFAPMFVAHLPYLTRSEWVADQALYEMYQNYPAFQEMADKQNVVWLGSVVPSEVVMVSKKPIATLEDLQGLKIRAMGAVNEEMKLLGATPVAMDVSEIYEGLDRGVIDAATGIPITLAVGLKLHEVAKFFVFPGFGIYNTSSLYMNKDVYEKLPDDVKAAFKTVFDTFIDEYSGDMFMANALKESKKAVEEVGGTVTVISKDQQEVWKEKLAPVEQNFVKMVTDAGYDGAEILSKYKELVDKYIPQDMSYSPY